MDDTAAKNQQSRQRDWSPRFWEGCDYFAYLKLLARNRFAVGPAHWPIALIAHTVTFTNTLGRWFQHGLYHSRVKQTPIQPPIFVIGHWRTGTTLLHELMTLDPRHGSPTTLHCMCPCHFLVSESALKKWGGFLLPEKRPMDNMAVGWDKPQEDEFALALLGMPSTYTDIAFPNRPPLDPGSLDLSGLSPRQLRDWERTLIYFLKSVQFRDRRRLVLKSPPHTARVPILQKLFPGAKFIHIMRNPYDVYPSTVNLWKSFFHKHGFQTPRNVDAVVEQKVLSEFLTIYDRLEEAKPMIPAGDFAEVRYEDLTADMIGSMERIYQELSLPNFELLRPRLEAYQAANQGYQKNRFEMPAEQREKVRQHWGRIIDLYGY